ncbi:hypothetical protein CC117_25535 [Parafrankia colletiae]|uniref:Uncharacterized protein n=1 Tax=Parafrankia colletiae TaxID=573497 RepID=A0A1S1QDG4_9ACTN|nr:hypothetical protein [Parafrankia colletiae]MCK9902154.1 hypothetical protein [Frankia sp. Cpl3]OHV31697.1 hypothetical protein CC117_25535 [Parafrankia colletiae]
MLRLQQAVIEEFATWASAEGSVPGAGLDGAGGGGPGRQWRDRIAILLQARADHLGRPDPTRWRSGDVHDLFMAYVVPRQVDAWGLAAHGLDTIRDFLRFLDATDRLHPASIRVATLLKELDRLAGKYPAAMADTSRWQLAKRVFTAILADGLSLDDDDPAVLDDWAARFSARDAAGRRLVLGELMDDHPGYATGRLLIHEGQVAILASGRPPAKHLVWPDAACDCGCQQQARFPAVSLPDEATLARQIATGGAGVLRRLALLATWAASDEGRNVDSRGDLRRADRPALLAALDLPEEFERRGGTPALARLWQLAIEFDVIQLRRTRVVPGATAAHLQDALAGAGKPELTVELWTDLADVLIQPVEPPTKPREGEHLRDWLRPWVPWFLGSLYTATAAGEPADLDLLTDEVLDDHADQVPPGDPEMFAALAAASIRMTLASLADHGAVTVTGAPEDIDPRQAAAAAAIGTAPWAVLPSPGLTVDLTDLGRHLVRRHLLAENADAPLAGHGA